MKMIHSALYLCSSIKHILYVGETFIHKLLITKPNFIYLDVLISVRDLRHKKPVRFFLTRRTEQASCDGGL